MTNIINSSTLDTNPSTMTTNRPTDARFWKRIYASLIDGTIISFLSLPFVIFFVPFFMYNYNLFHRLCLMSQDIVGGPLSINIVLVSSGLYLLLTQIITVIYYSYYLSSIDQATLGMKIHYLKLVNGENNRPSFVQIFLREIISLISFLVLSIGYLMILFTKRRQALHDMVTSTYVQDNSDDSNIEILISQYYRDYSYAGFWYRLGAFIVDILIIYILNFISLYICSLIIFNDHYIFQNVNQNVSQGPSIFQIIVLTFLQYFIPIFYWVYFTASKFQATPGKILFSLKVVGDKGERLTIFRAFLRYALEIFSTLTLGIGFIMAAFTERKQALHDKIIRTYVIRVVKKSIDNNN